MKKECRRHWGIDFIFCYVAFIGLFHLYPVFVPLGKISVAYKLATVCFSITCLLDCCLIFKKQRSGFSLAAALTILQLLALLVRGPEILTNQVACFFDHSYSNFRFPVFAILAIITASLSITYIKEKNAILNVTYRYCQRKYDYDFNPISFSKIIGEDESYYYMRICYSKNVKPPCRLFVRREKGGDLIEEVDFDFVHSKFNEPYWK